MSDDPDHEHALMPDEMGKHRRVDLTSRDRVTTIYATNARALRHMWIAIVGLWIAAALAGYFLWRNNQDIQASREQATFETCQESNDRHDRTIVAFNIEFNRALKRETDPARRRQIEQSRQSNVRLINVFIPVHKDSAGRSTCKEFARGRVNVDG